MPWYGRGTCCVSHSAVRGQVPRRCRGLEGCPIRRSAACPLRRLLLPYRLQPHVVSLRRSLSLLFLLSQRSFLQSHAHRGLHRLLFFHSTPLFTFFSCSHPDCPFTPLRRPSTLLRQIANAFSFLSFGCIARFALVAAQLIAPRPLVPSPPTDDRRPAVLLAVEDPTRLDAAPSSS